MTKPIKSQHKPLYKKSKRISEHSTTLFMVTMERRNTKHVMRLANGGRRYLVSFVGALMMSVAALALGGILAFVYYFIFNELNIFHWLMWLPFVGLWLWLTEHWWCGLTTCKFADCFANKMIIYGAFGREKYVFDYRQCAFFYTRVGAKGVSIPLWVNCHQRKKWIRIDTAICADWENFLTEVEADDWVTSFAMTCRQWFLSKLR